MVTQIRQLNKAGRIEEIARMLGGDDFSKESLAHANKLFASQKEYLIGDGLLSKAWEFLSFIDDHTAWAQPRLRDREMSKMAGYKKKINGIEISEYAPRKIKKSVTGNGNASKEQLSEIIKKTLSPK